MLQYDSAPLRVLYLGGTGTISTSCARLSAESGMAVTVLNRGRKQPPAGTEALVADVADEASLSAALRDREFDAVVNFLSFDAEDATRKAAFFASRSRQYVHISSASIYAKPVRQLPITESTPTGPNPPLPYATAKWEAERALQGLPVTIVRPSHTYDDDNPPLPGGWATVERIARGEEIPVHGDGTSLWTLTHAEDFAQGLVGLLGNPRALGETFTITGADVYTWDQIYTIVAEALGVRAKLVHVASEMFPLVAPDWFWSGEMVGDIGHSAVFDTSKIRTFVPGFAPRLTFHRAAARMVARRPPVVADDGTDAVLDRIVAAYHAARKVFAA
ncbi:NAD-dependent epimerase/dehydratase family protein [Actinoplanes sp. CA-030573]|uniref:NAD-dependent epimerase/dehydratase family protein n=1 Tax=Actinoplanes sp. CA-030573 TaxID=3239898 RepID=UPI003D8FBCA0